jgi:hypothetical protein
VKSSGLCRELIVGTCILALAAIAAPAQDQGLARTPHEVAWSTLAATFGAPNLPQLRLTQAWWTVTDESNYQHANSAALDERPLYHRAIWSSDGWRATVNWVNEVDVQTATRHGGSGAFAAEFLTSAQRAEIWHSLSEHATRTSVPMGLNVGETVPNTIRLLSFADALRKSVPPIWPYSYALLHGQVLIVDPRSKTIIAIISGGDSGGAEEPK